MKKLLSLLLSAVLLLSFASCGKNKDDVGYLNINSQKVEVDYLLEIDGIKIPFDMFRYCFFTATEYLEQATLDFDKADAKNKEAILEETISQAKYLYAIEDLAKKNGISLTEDELKEIETTMESTFTSAGSASKYKELLEENYLSPRVYEQILKANALYEKMVSELVGTDKKKNKIVVTADEAIEGYSQRYCRIMSIYFFYNVTNEDGDPLSEDEIKKLDNEAKNNASKAYNEIKNGTDFDTVFKKYMGEDLYEEELQKYYSVSEISSLLNYDMSKVEIGEVTEPIYAQQNYFILKRLPIDKEFLKEKIDAVIPVYSEIRIEEEIEKLCEGYKIEKLEDFDKASYEAMS